MFFSFLSVMIVVMLFALFLSNVQEQNIPEVFRGTDESAYLLNSWLFAGVLAVATCTVPLGFLNRLVEDRVSLSLNDFFVTPLDRSMIVFSYLISAMVLSLFMGVIVLAVGQLVLFVSASTMLPAFDVMKLFALVAFTSTVFSAIGFYVISLIRTMNAASALNTLVGTLIGFLAGIYVPIGEFGTILQNTLNILPPMQVASLYRRIYMDSALAEMFAHEGVAEAEARYRDYAGIDVELFGMSLESGHLFALLIAWLAVFLVLSLLRIRRFKI